MGDQYRSPYKFVHNHNLVSISTLQKKYPNFQDNDVININLVYQLEQLINDNNNYVNLHDVTNLGLYNKLILVTQK